MTKKAEEKKKCGIVMPIAAHPEYPSNHWNDVLTIIKEAVAETEFQADLVSNSSDVGLIHERIVNNLYSNQIVVVDVSSKNPNVMFELGLRLAFDKPTIIIKDERTGYTFDVGGIEHLEYPSSLRFSEIVSFKEHLVKKINATYQKSQEESGYSPFLKSFGTKIVPSKISETEIPESKYIINSLERLTSEVQHLKYTMNTSPTTNNNSYIEKVIREEIKDFAMTSGPIDNISDFKTIQTSLKNLTGQELPMVDIMRIAGKMGFISKEITLKDLSNIDKRKLM